MGLLSQCQGPQKVHICHLQTLFYRPFYIPWSLPEVSKNAPVWVFQICIDQKSMIYFLENAFVCNCMNKGFSWLRILFFYMTTSFKKADKNSFWSICIDGITFEKDIMEQNLAENNRLGAFAWLTLCSFETSRCRGLSIETLFEHLMIPHGTHINSTLLYPYVRYL